MREQELKYRLPDADALARCARVLPAPVRIEAQHNLYFDTASLALHAHGMLVRVRLFADGAATLTVKTDARIQPGLITAREEERRLSTAEAEAFTCDPGAALECLDPALAALVRQRAPTQALACVGALHTLRRVVRVPAGEIALDTVTFPDGGTDHELELETEDVAAGRRFLEALFARARVPAVEEDTPKSGRLFVRTGQSRVLEQRPRGPIE